MNKVRKTVSVLLITLLALAMSGCFLASDAPTAFENTVKGYGIKKCEKRSDLIKAVASLSKEGSGYYVSTDEKEVALQYRTVFNPKKDARDIQPDEYKYAAIREKGDVTMHTCAAYVFTFNSKSDAEEVFEIAKDRITSNSRAKAKDSGKKQDYSYAISYQLSGATRTVVAAYLEDKSVVYLQGTSYKNEINEFAEYFCKKMKYVSPIDLIED